MTGEIDNIVNSMFKQPGNLGLIVGVVKQGQSSVFSYGKMIDSLEEPPRGDTLFEIGSVTKVFTTALLSILVSEGLINLNDSVRDLMPRLSNLPREITLARLATHTAGFPKMPSNIIWTMLRNRSNPYAKYPTTKLFEFLSKYKSKRQLTEDIQYSNLSVALLGHVLAETLSTSYEQAIINRICDKLDMPDTRITLSSEQEERLSSPHSRKGKPSSNWDIPAFAGAGALRSSVNDLLKFLSAHLGKPGSALTDALQLSHEKRPGSFSPPGRPSRLFLRISRKKKYWKEPYHQGIALGWMMGHLGAEGSSVYWHHGAMGGYMAFTGFVKNTDTGVAVLINRGPFFSEGLSNISMIDEIGFKVLELYDTSR
ncbi:MAG: serine hydrolase domain-containing protein [Candidatus Hodarchaeales archaeon]|jgi:CubicO group peptidase (beta-lactamase class C family)